MKNEKSKNIKQVTKASLSEKQSVRTTFKLSQECINVIDWLVKTNHLKPKEIFDLMSSIDDWVNLAIEAAKKEDEKMPVKHTRKTFVISKQTLRLLNKKSKEHNVIRDLIAEKLVLLFKSLLEKLTIEEKQKEEEALSIISDFETKAEEIENKLKDLLNAENPILERFGMVIVVIMNLVSAIERKLKNDFPIDPDDFSQS